MKHALNTRVKVTSATDETTDTRFIGKIGIVVGYNENGETGNTAADPLHNVSFNTAQFDKGQPIPESICENDTQFDDALTAATISEQFWFEELTAI